MPRSVKSFIFNMLQGFAHVHTAVHFGDNPPRVNEQARFRLSTLVDKPVDNSMKALEAGFLIPTQISSPYSNKLFGWMDCG